MEPRRSILQKLAQLSEVFLELGDREYTAHSQMLRAQFMALVGEPLPVVTREFERAVTMAIKRLKRDALIVVGGEGQITLTDGGREIANRLLNRHHLIERILLDHRAHAGHGAEGEGFFGIFGRAGGPACDRTTGRNQLKRADRQRLGIGADHQKFAVGRETIDDGGDGF